MTTDSSGNCTCADCGESVPRAHTLMTAHAGRVCWFCYTDEYDESELDAYDDDLAGVDYDDWGDW